MKKVFYAVKPQLENIDGFVESNGWKWVTGYIIDGDKLEQLFEFECGYSENTLNEIEQWFDEQGQDFDGCTLIEL